MTVVDVSKGVWRVVGSLPKPATGRRVVFVNAATGTEALELGRKEGLTGAIRATYHLPVEIEQWKALADNSKPMTSEEIEAARQYWNAKVVKE